MTIAIIDDNFILQTHLKKMLEQYSNVSDIMPFYSVENALEYFNQSPEEFVVPDIILLDINFPGLDGWDFLEEFEIFNKKLSKTPNIYLISSSIQESDKEKYNNNDFINGYFTKPISSEHLNQLGVN